jgi:hypothetical protein
VQRPVSRPWPLAFLAGRAPVYPRPPHRLPRRHHRPPLRRDHPRRLRVVAPLSVVVFYCLRRPPHYVAAYGYDPDVGGQEQHFLANNSRVDTFDGEDAEGVADADDHDKAPASDAYDQGVAEAAHDSRCTSYRRLDEQEDTDDGNTLLVAVVVAVAVGDSGP